MGNGLLIILQVLSIIIIGAFLYGLFTIGAPATFQTVQDFIQPVIDTFENLSTGFGLLG